MSRFGLLRRWVVWLVWWQSSNPINRAWFAICNPILAYRVHRLTRLLLAGRGELEA